MKIWKNWRPDTILKIENSEKKNFEVRVKMFLNLRKFRKKNWKIIIFSVKYVAIVLQKNYVLLNNYTMYKFGVFEIFTLFSVCKF